MKKGFFAKFGDALFIFRAVRGAGSKDVVKMKERLSENGVAAIMDIVHAVADGTSLVSEFYQMRWVIDIPEEFLDGLLISAKQENPKTFRRISEDLWENREVFYQALPLLNKKEVDSAISHYLDTPNLLEEEVSEKS